MAKGIEAMLQKLQFKDLLKICDAEGLPKNGKKVDIIKRILENVPRDKLMKHFLSIRGINDKILEHEYVPKHRVLKKEEVEELLNKYGIKKWQLPKILDHDPVVMLLDAKPGDVIEITRESETAGEAKYYRVVIKGVKEE